MGCGVWIAHPLDMQIRPFLDGAAAPGTERLRDNGSRPQRPEGEEEFLDLLLTRLQTILGRPPGASAFRGDDTRPSRDALQRLAR